MRENCLYGSEGGARDIPCSDPYQTYAQPFMEYSERSRNRGLGR